MKISNSIIQKLIFIFLFLNISYFLYSIDEEKYSVNDVFVEIELVQNEDNRKEAIFKAYEIALSRYLEWITLLSRDELEKEVSNINAESLTAGYSIENEKFSKTTYSALITVKFDKTKIENFLKEKEIKYYLGLGSKTLLIPLIKFEDRIILWDDPNPWFEAWIKRPLDSNLTEFILPVGDIEDLIILSAEDVDNLAFSKIKNLSYKYDASNLLILTLEVKKTNTKFNLKLDATNGLTGDSIVLNAFNYNNDLSFDENLFRLANNFARHYDDLWVKKNINKIDLQVKIKLNIKFANFSDWNNLKKLLINADSFSKLEIVRLTKETATVKINLLSKIDLISSLEEMQYKVVQNEYEWEIISLN